MAYSKKISHVAEGLANLISLFEDKPKILKLFSIYLGQLQELENAFSDLLTETTLDNSTGLHLDNIGEIVGESREGRTDVQYRTAIRVRINLNKSGGTIEDLINLATGIAGTPIDISIDEIFPAGFLANILTPISPGLTDVSKISTFVASGRAGGVRGLLAFGVEGSFQYDGPAATGYDSGKYGGVLVA